MLSGLKNAKTMVDTNFKPRNRSRTRLISLLKSGGCTNEFEILALYPSVCNRLYSSKVVYLWISEVFNSLKGMSFVIGKMDRHDSKAVVLNNWATEFMEIQGYPPNANLQENIRPYWGMMEVDNPLIRFIGGAYRGVPLDFHDTYYNLGGSWIPTAPNLLGW